MATTNRDLHPSKSEPQVTDLSIEGKSIPLHAHVAYFWETDKEFADAVHFLEVGLRGIDHCVIFGHEEANEAVSKVLQERGFDLSALKAEGRVTVLGGNPNGERILETIGAAFQQALANGAPLIRLLGNIGWGKPQWPDEVELLAFEAKVTDATQQFPCVVVCMYDVRALSGLIMHHGGFETHPLVVRGRSLQKNPYYVPTEIFLHDIEAIAADISVRRQAEEALRTSEDRFRSLFENSIDAVLIATPAGVVEAANPEACRLFGRTEDEICRIGRAGLVDLADPRLRALLEERERTGVFRGELTFRRKDGSKFPGEVSSAFYKDKSGATKASVIIRDISERKRAEELLRTVTEGTAAVTGSDFFHLLIQHLANALEVRYAFVAECTDATNTHVRTVAFWNGEDFGENVAYPLHGTPCENVIGGQVCSYPDRIQSLFPQDKDLITLAAEGYLGAPLHDASGKILGHLAVMDTKPMKGTPQEMSILKIFAARAGAELERQQADEKLRRAYDDTRRLSGELGALLDVNRAIGRHLERDALFGALARCLQGLLQTDRFGIELPLDDDKLQGHLLTPRGGLAQPTQPHVMPAAGTACKWVLQNRQWIVTASRDDLRERFPVTFQVMSREGMESLCAIPLLTGEICRGVLFCMAAAEGAYEHLPQPLLEKVAVAVAVALDDCLAHEEVRRLRDRLAAENVYLQEEIKSEYNFEEIIGQSGPLLKILKDVEQVASTDVTVLIQGETGTGKELLARAIHNLSPRKDRPLVKVNCGAIPTGLVESELFGHEKGAFTGASERRIGRFELADGGTIFLDEVTELPLDTQVKLLRVLQEGEFERVGSSQTIKVDVRIIAATNRDVQAVLKAGSFRSDLFYRLNVLPLKMPSLRERKSDIPLLVNFFLDRFAKKLNKQVGGASKGTMDRLTNYPWPGNIRELQNVLERAVVLARGPIIHVDESFLQPDAASSSLSVNTLEDVERSHILRVLEEFRWVIHGEQGAASALGINPSTLRSRMQKLGIRRPSGHS